MSAGSGLVVHVVPVRRETSSSAAVRLRPVPAEPDGSSPGRWLAARLGVRVNTISRAPHAFPSTPTATRSSLT